MRHVNSNKFHSIKGLSMASSIDMKKTKRLETVSFHQRNLNDEDEHRKTTDSKSSWQMTVAQIVYCCWTMDVVHLWRVSFIVRTVDSIRFHRVKLCSNDEEKRKRFSLYKCKLSSFDDDSQQTSIVFLSLKTRGKKSAENNSF